MSRSPSANVDSENTLPYAGGSAPGEPSRSFLIASLHMLRSALLSAPLPYSVDDYVCHNGQKDKDRPLKHASMPFHELPAPLPPQGHATPSSKWTRSPWSFTPQGLQATDEERPSDVPPHREERAHGYQGLSGASTRTGPRSGTPRGNSRCGFCAGYDVEQHEGQSSHSGQSRPQDADDSQRGRMEKGMLLE